MEKTKIKNIKESYETTVLKPYTAGFIKEDGSFIIADIYDDYIHGGCSKEILDQDYPEFSNTHAEDDTCVRIMKEPNEIQYKKLEEIIDQYLDWEGYCKIEVWDTATGKPHLYDVCSLFEGACEDFREDEIVDNWTGYKLVQKIKNYFNNIICDDFDSTKEYAVHHIDNNHDNNSLENISLMPKRRHDSYHNRLNRSLKDKEYKNFNSKDYEQDIIPIGKMLLNIISKDGNDEIHEACARGYLTEKIVKKGNKWQVQSEKGRNMGTYDTKEEAEKRLKQVEYFKHMNEDIDIPIDVGLSDNPIVVKDDSYNVNWYYFGDCISTVDGNYPDEDDEEYWDYYGPEGADEDAPYWDATEMAQALEKAIVYTGPKKLIDAPKEALAKNVVCGVIEDRDIGFVYNIDNDIHYFFDIGSELSEQVDYFKPINESTRSSLISKSKNADKYANGKGSRWTAKSNCNVASTVKDYNKIDMNTFWKEDKLTFGVKVEGETNTYNVTISFKDILPKIQKKISENKQLLEFKCIYDALIQAINSGDVKISCTCPDYKYRIKYWNSKNGDEAGDKETRATDKTNPNDSKGPACKHILAVLNNVEWLNKIASVINNYANYCKDNMQYNYSKFIFPKLYGMPYNKAVQMVLDDYDENGEVKDELKSDEEIINLANALGKERGKFKKGSNKNPAAKKKEESLRESLQPILENFDNDDDLKRHYEAHCVKNKYGKDHLLFTEYKNKEEYKKGAIKFIQNTKHGAVKILDNDPSKPAVVCYCKWKYDSPTKQYTYAQYFVSKREKKRKITTYLKYNQFEFATIALARYQTENLPEWEANIKEWENIPDDEIKKIKDFEKEILDSDLKADTKEY